MERGGGDSVTVWVQKRYIFRISTEEVSAGNSNSVLPQCRRGSVPDEESDSYQSTTPPFDTPGENPRSMNSTLSDLRSN